jgi:hypothetical protein
MLKLAPFSYSKIASPGAVVLGKALCSRSGCETRHASESVFQDAIKKTPGAGRDPRFRGLRIVNSAGRPQPYQRHRQGAAGMNRVGARVGLDHEHYEYSSRH